MTALHCQWFVSNIVGCLQHVAAACIPGLIGQRYKSDCEGPNQPGHAPSKHLQPFTRQHQQQQPQQQQQQQHILRATATTMAICQISASKLELRLKPKLRLWLTPEDLAETASLDSLNAQSALQLSLLVVA